MQIAMGTFVSYFFSGFILGKIPFPLSPSFRLMLQASLTLPQSLSGEGFRAAVWIAEHADLCLTDCCCRGQCLFVFMLTAPQGPALAPSCICIEGTHCTFFIGNEGNILAKTRTHMVCRLADVT